ncbi:MAG: hypothetical protein HYU75_10900 [Betaproteobacteria bacterium]|nr:hypothetical protein [Betaproteobacteria bacterium]
MVVSSNFPANTVREFIDQVKRRPGVFNFGSPGIGSSQHLGMELLKQETGINLVHVPYKGTAGVLNDIIAGLVQASVVALPSAVPYVQSGKLRMLAVMGTERAAKLPLVPTLAEVGVPNVIFEVWYGVMAPAGTPGAVVAKFNAEVNDLLALPDVKEVMDRQGVNPAGGKPEAFDSRVRSGIKLWTQVMTRGNRGIKNAKNGGAALAHRQGDRNKRRRFFLGADRQRLEHPRLRRLSRRHEHSRAGQEIRRHLQRIREGCFETRGGRKKGRGRGPSDDGKGELFCRFHFLRHRHLALP